MSKRSDLLKFLLEKKIPLRLAIQMLEQEEHLFLSNKKTQKEKAVIGKYETRVGG